MLILHIVALFHQTTIFGLRKLVQFDRLCLQALWYHHSSCLLSIWIIVTYVCVCVCVCRFFPMSAKVLTEWDFPSQFGHVKCCFSLGHFTSCEDRAATTIIVKLSLVLPLASRSYHGCLSMCQPLVGKWWLIQKGKIESQFEMHSQGQIYLMYILQTYFQILSFVLSE